MKLPRFLTITERKLNAVLAVQDGTSLQPNAAPPQGSKRDTRQIPPRRISLLTQFVGGRKHARIESCRINIQKMVAVVGYDEFTIEAGRLFNTTQEAGMKDTVTLCLLAEGLKKKKKIMFVGT